MIAVSQVRVETEGSTDEVVRVLQQLGTAGRHATAVGAGGSVETPAGSGDDAMWATGTQGVAGSRETAPAEW